MIESGEKIMSANADRELSLSYFATCSICILTYAGKMLWLDFFCIKINRTIPPIRYNIYQLFIVGNMMCFV